MTEETINGCIRHRDVRHLRLYYDLLDIYHNNEHKAKIIRIMETWTDSKRATWYKSALEQQEQGQLPPEPNFWITMSFQQFRHFMHDTVSVDTIKANLADLVKMKHLRRRVNPDNPYGPPQYLLNYELIQTEIDAYAPPPPFLPEVPTLEEEQPPQEKAPLPQGGKTATSNITSNTKNLSKNQRERTGDQQTGNSNISPSLSGANALAIEGTDSSSRPALYLVPRHTPKAKWDSTYQCDPLHIEDQFNAWRGGPPTTAEDCASQTKNCQALARLGSLQDVVNIRTEMYSHSPDYFSKPEHCESIEPYHVLKFWHEYRRRRLNRLANEQRKDTHHDEQSTSVSAPASSTPIEKRRAFSQYKRADEF